MENDKTVTVRLQARKCFVTSLINRVAIAVMAIDFPRNLSLLKGLVI